MSYSAQESNLELYTTIWTLKDTYVVEFTILWESLSVDYYLEEIIIIHVESPTFEGRSIIRKLSVLKLHSAYINWSGNIE